MGKGEDTKAAIVDQALNLVSTVGLEKLTIGALASATGMSKSGLFAHFDSKEQLQLQVLDEARKRFVDAVIAPALKKPRGEARIRALFENTMQKWETALPGGCVFSAVAAELDDQPGPARDYLVEVQKDYQDVVKRAAQVAIDVGEFRKNLDLGQFAFEFGSITAAYHHFGRLLHDSRAEQHAYSAFEALLSRSH
ncbi:MAG TPA: TetR/AcrR family transcriptional regulator [Polyangiales bacterium]|jgi:AcrR family transcriptional regulator|nr:TetR/AcrR family transcriptional regulator [Polyangiales bacterium]